MIGPVMMSESVIRAAVRHFEQALRIMDRDRTPVHAFDFGKGADGKMYSLMLMIAPKEDIDKLGPLPARPLEMP